MTEIVHWAYRVVGDTYPQPRSAVCDGDAVGSLTFNEDEVTCVHCIEQAKIRWWR